MVYSAIMTSPIRRFAPLFLLSLLVACASTARVPDPTGRAPRDPQAVALDGRELTTPRASAERLDDLDRAWARYRTEPTDEDAIVWLGRRLAYVGRFDEAVEAFTVGLEHHPKSYRLLRHRGHRFITLRDFDRAARDLTRAAKLIEGRPAQAELPRVMSETPGPESTLQFAIDYHLGLALYLAGDFERARAAYRSCLTHSTINDDKLCATTYWLYLTELRRGANDEAREVLDSIGPDLDVRENLPYFRMLLLFKGELDVEDLPDDSRDRNASTYPTWAYGLSQWHRAHGRTERETELLNEILQHPRWSAFGFIAAEACRTAR